MHRPGGKLLIHFIQIKSVDLARVSTIKYDWPITNLKPLIIKKRVKIVKTGSQKGDVIVIGHYNISVRITTWLLLPLTLCALILYMSGGRDLQFKVDSER